MFCPVMTLFVIRPESSGREAGSGGRGGKVREINSTGKNNSVWVKRVMLEADEEVGSVIFRCLIQSILRQQYSKVVGVFLVGVDKVAAWLGR